MIMSDYQFYISVILCFVDIFLSLCLCHVFCSETYVFFLTANNKLNKMITLGVV